MDNDSNGLTEFKVKGIVLYKREGVLMQVQYIQLILTCGGRRKI
jgi:hypothetical protein